MQSQAQPLISLFRAIVLAGVTALLISSAALPMAAQNSVPPTAVQAARTPKFARRLAHQSSRPASRPNPALARKGSRSGPGQFGVIYDNGPIDGTSDAWTINFGYIVSDTFTLTQYNTVTGFDLGVWEFPGDVLSSLQWSITSGPNSGTVYASGTVSGSNLMDTFISTNQYGYNIDKISASGLYLNLDIGTFWFNVQNASVPSGDPVYWDENSGVGCQSEGCPSQAEQSSVGTIPSESFTIAGDNCISPTEARAATAAKIVTAPASPTQNYRVIYNFTGAGDGASPFAGLVLDAAGNLYGTTGGGGPAGGGTVFKLTPSASGWRFSRVYSFIGANGSGPDSTLVLGPDGRLYGTTGGGGLGDGVLFGLSPAANILPSVFSNWMESLLYSFTGGSDGGSPGGSLVVDSAGNIYGNAAKGGANRGGTLYEFTNGGIQILHAFPAFRGDGNNPIGVVSGSDGLYGITGSGGNMGAGTLYTTAGGYQVLHNFAFNYPEGSPNSLAADQAGNLYGTSIYSSPCGVADATVFQSSPPGWDPVPLASIGPDATGLLSWITTDALGNIYGTTNNDGAYFSGTVFELTCCWNYTSLHDFGGPNDGAQPMAGPVVDAQGNIYGTTSYGGTYGQGVVWEISP